MKKLATYETQAILNRLEMIEGNADFIARLMPTMAGVCENTKNLARDVRGYLLRASLADIEVEPAREKETV